MGAIKPLAPLAIILCLGGAIQKIGLLLMLDTEVFGSTGATSVTMAAIYLPIPLTNLLFLVLVIRNPGSHLALSYLALSGFLCFHSHLNLPGMAGLIAAGVWFSLAAQGVLGASHKSWIKPITNAMLITGILAELAGAIIANVKYEWFYILALLAVTAAILSTTTFSRSTTEYKHSTSFSELKNFPFNKTILVGLIVITAGFADATLLGKLHQWGLGSETYGWLLFGHSLFSLLALCAPCYKWSWVSWNALWYLSVACVIWGTFWYAAFGFAGLGAAGTVVMRDLRVDYLVNSKNPVRMAALVSVVLSGFMATGAIIGGLL